MKKIDFPLWSDTIFFFACSFLVSLCILRYYDLSMWPAALLSAALAFAFAVLVFGLGYLWRRKKFLLKRDLEEKEKLMLHLTLEQDDAVRTLLANALRTDGKEATLQDDTIMLDDAPLIPVFTMQPVSADTVARLLKTYGKTPFLIACNALTPEAEHLLTSFSRSAMLGEEIYALFSRTETIPETLICGEIPRRTARTRLRIAFSKRNAYPFFVSGAGLLVMSLFVFFPIYYLVTGSLLLIASVCIRAFGYA